LRRLTLTLTVAAVFAAALGCKSSSSGGVDKLTQELLSSSKEQLFTKGKALMERKKYEQGRKYLSFVFETYPNEPEGRESLMLVADSYFKQGGSGYTEARYRYRDYLNRYPDAKNRDYARYQFAVCYDREIERPDRDQTATLEAIQQYRNLMREFPDSAYASAARDRIRELADILAEHEFAVGFFYLRKGSPAAALSRFTTLEERFPDYGQKDKLFYNTARALERLGRTDEARRYLERLLDGFPQSDYAGKAKKMAADLPAPTAAAATETN
jgi:outer membrane protein assembly factor BamD